MPDPLYYIEKPSPQFDSSWLSALGGAISAGISALSPVPGDKEIINFTISSIVEGGTSFSIEAVAMELEYIDSSQVRIGDTVYPVDVTIDATVTTAASVYIASLLTPPGATISTIMAIGIVVGTTINFVYSKFVDPITEQILDQLAGTVDVDVILHGEGAGVLGGALYKDGIGDSSELEVAVDLLTNAVSQGISDNVTEDLYVEIVHGSGLNGTYYYLYEDDVLSEIAQLKGISSTYAEEIVMDEYASGEIARLDPYGVDNYNVIVADNAAGFEIDGKFYLVKDILYGDTALLGFERDNLIIGTNQDDTILSGNGGDDAIYGNDGGDLLLGGGGHDILDGGDDDDELYGDSGNDILYGSAGEDTLDGGDGADIADYSHVSGGISVEFSAPGEATVTKLATGEVDTLQGIEIIIGTSGSDMFDLTNAGKVTILGDDGGDYYTIDASAGASGFTATIVEQVWHSGNDIIEYINFTPEDTYGVQKGTLVNIRPDEISGPTLEVTTAIEGIDYRTTPLQDGTYEPLENYIDENEDDQPVPDPTEAPRNEASPLILDLGTTGITLSSIDDPTGQVYWDLDNDGFAEMSAWVGAEDGLLALDRNGDGVVTDHTELFGTASVDGFVMLAELDLNNDQVIDVNDAAFEDLIVWVDANTDGVSEASELYSLGDLDIASIDLDYYHTQYDISGNSVSSASTYTLTDNTQHQIIDAWFEYDDCTSSEYCGHVA